MCSPGSACTYLEVHGISNYLYMGPLKGILQLYTYAWGTLKGLWGYVGFGVPGT